MKYMRESLTDEYGILAFQDALLEIMVYIDKYCSEHDIDYCLMAGSALGAERHKGFIPWDDDIDIYMSESGYEQFRRYFVEDGDHEKYYLQEWGKTTLKGHQKITMAKLRMNGTQLNEKTYMGWKMHQGLFVDIFILHNSSNSRLKQKIQYAWSEAVVLKGLEVRGYKAKNNKDRVLLFASRMLPTKLLLKAGLKNVYKYEHKRTSYVHGFIDTRGFNRGIFPKDIFFPAKYTDFETVRLKVPACNSEYLRIQFGEDYMTPPPMEKRPINKHTSGWIKDSSIRYSDLSDENRLI